jgi:hypothetical protein
VSLKRVSKSRHPYEAEIAELFSSDPLAMDPQNHCVPILQILAVPDDADLIVIIMPLLREYDSPRFDTIGEAVECIRQLFEVWFQWLYRITYVPTYTCQGLHFMHQHHVAHRLVHLADTSPISCP